MHNIQAKHTTVPNNPNIHASRGVIQAQELLLMKGHVFRAPHVSFAAR